MLPPPSSSLISIQDSKYWLLRKVKTCFLSPTIEEKKKLELDELDKKIKNLKDRQKTGPQSTLWD